MYHCKGVYRFPSLCVCVWEFIYIYGNVCVGTDLAPTVAVMKQSDQKHLTRGQDSSDWYKSSLREVRGRSQTETSSQKAIKQCGLAHSLAHDQLAFLYSLGSLAQVMPPTDGWALIHQLIRQSFINMPQSPAQ